MNTGDLTTRLGENIRFFRARAHISQEELAFRADIHRTQITLIESGRRLPRLDTVMKLAAALEIELAALLAGITYRRRLYADAGGFEVSPDSLFEVGAPAQGVRSGGEG